MIVNAFYNKEGVGDTLLIETGEVTFENREWERRGDVARILIVKQKSWRDITSLIAPTILILLQMVRWI